MPATLERRALALLETGAVAWLGLLLGRMRPAASRAADGRRAVTDVHHQTAFTDLNRDTKLEHQRRADNPTPACTD